MALVLAVSRSRVYACTVIARCCWIAAAPASAEAFNHDDIATIINEPSSRQPNINPRPLR